MLKKVQKALNSPDLALDHVVNAVLAKKPRRKLFASSAKYRSVSDNGKYVAEILKFLQNQTAFNKFKRNRLYRAILEHVTKEQGATYMNEVKSRHSDFMDLALETVLMSDATGNPRKYVFDGVDIPLSPTTLRYVKVASDLMLLFGKNINNVAEIGCGYGGQCLVNDKLLGYKHATLFDLPFVNELIKRYLDYSLMEGSYEVATINQKAVSQYDLVISNYAFSELPEVLQETYIDKVIKNSRRGYLTMNSGIGGVFQTGRMNIARLRALLPKFECLEENPLTYPYNFIIVWGHDPEALDTFFTRKLV